MDVPSLESLAIETYERAGLDASRPVSTLRLARALLKDEDAIIRPPSMLGSPAALLYVGGLPRIAVKKSIPIEYARFFVGHELGHLVLAQAGYREEDLEVCCDYLGAALMAPRPAIYGLQRAFGFDLPKIAGAVGSTQTWAALRCAEVLGMPLAVIAPKVRVRGPDEWVWPEEKTLRAWARRPPRGLARTSLTDDPKRVVLIADELDVG